MSRTLTAAFLAAMACAPNPAPEPFGRQPNASARPEASAAPTRPPEEPAASAAAPEVAAPAAPTPQATPVPTEVAPPTPRPTPTPVPTGAVRVRVLVKGPDGKTLPAPDAVAWFPALRGTPAPALKMASREKRFEPRVLAVPKGTTVTFPNQDKIFHNVFSLSEASRFDLGLYRNGASRSASFEKPGVVSVYCNIHPQMAAFVVVVEGIFGQTGKDGVVSFPSVPAGRHGLKVWEERGGEWSGTVVVTPNGTAEVAVSLDATAWREKPHKNKHGKDYPPPDDDENRY